MKGEFVVSNILASIAVVVAATATVVYSFWQKAQEAKANEQINSFVNNPTANGPPSYYYQGGRGYMQYPQYAQPVGQYYVPAQPQQQMVYQYYTPAPMVWDNYYQTWVYAQPQVMPQRYYQEAYPAYPVMTAPVDPQSRRYMDINEVNMLRAEQMRHPQNMLGNNILMPGMEQYQYAYNQNPVYYCNPYYNTTVPVNDTVYENRLHHRARVDMHDPELPPLVDPILGYEYTCVYDYDNSRREPTDHLKFRFNRMQPIQKNIQFDAPSIEQGNWYHQPMGVPYFKHKNDEDYLRNDENNRKARELGIYYTPTQEFKMKGQPMPIIRSECARKYDKSSLPYVSPNEAYDYMNNLGSARVGSTTVLPTSKTTDHKCITHSITGDVACNYYQYTNDPTYDAECKYYAYADRTNNSYYTDVAMHPDSQSPLRPQLIVQNNPAESQGVANSTNRFHTDPRNRTIIFNPATDPRPLIKREGIPLRPHDVYQYWVDNGEAGCCGYSYGDPTRDTTPVNTRYRAPEPFDDASYYNAIYVDGGGLHYSYQDYLYEIRYRDVYTNKDDDPLTHLCPYDFETRTDLYHWRKAVFTKYKYDPYPYAMRDDVWRDDLLDELIFANNWGSNRELAAIAHLRWYRQQKIKEQWRRERTRRERAHIRQFYVDRALGIHNIPFIPADPCDYISPEMYQAVDGSWNKTPDASDMSVYEKIADCKHGIYYTETKPTPRSNREPVYSTGNAYMDRNHRAIQELIYGHQSDNNADDDYIEDWRDHDDYSEYDSDEFPTGEIVYVYDPEKERNKPKVSKPRNVTPNYRQTSNSRYVPRTGIPEIPGPEEKKWKQAPYWYNDEKFWDNVQGDEIESYGRRTMKAQYPSIADNAVYENMHTDLGNDNSICYVKSTVGQPDDPYAAVFNLPEHYPAADQINNLLNRYQAPKGFHFTGDPNYDRMRIALALQCEMSDKEKLAILDDIISHSTTDQLMKKHEADGLSDLERYEILQHNISLPANMERTYVYIDDYFIAK